MLFDLYKNEDQRFINNKIVETYTSKKMVAFFKKLNLTVEEVTNSLSNNNNKIN